MDNKTNKGLVEYVKKALNEKWGYVWGTFGQTLTETLFNQKLSQYPEQVGSYKNFILNNWMGKRVTDCVGLIKGYMWLDEETSKIIYDSKTDVNANMMYSNAEEKGIIDTIPEITGLCVYKKGHIGVYIGNGQVIEARGTKYGVIQSPLKGNNSAGWTHWLKCPYIEYKEATKEKSEISSWAREAATWVKEKGISDGTRPKDVITREEVWTMLYRYYDFINKKEVK